jgi:hypothetical protein
MTSIEPAAGQGAEPGGEAAGPGGVDVGGGSSFVIDQAGFAAICKALLHDPAVVGMLAAQAQEMCDEANASATVKGAAYAVTVVADWPDSSRARANVWTSNIAAMADDARNSTLLKVLARAGGSAGQ